MRHGHWDLTVAATFDMTSLTLGQLRGLAQSLAQSEVVPDDLMGKPANVFAVLLRGAELGLSAMTSVLECMVIKGKLVLSSHVQVALVTRSGRAKIPPKVKYVDDHRCIVETQRIEWDQPTEIEFTYAEAEARGLTKPSKKTGEASNWVKMRRTMLRRRTLAIACREYYGDVVIAYDHGEIEVEETLAAPAPLVAPGTAVGFNGASVVDDNAPAFDPEIDGSDPTDAARMAEGRLKEYERAARAAKNTKELDRAQSIMKSYIDIAKEDELAAAVCARAEKIYVERYRDLTAPAKGRR